jgi:hypothetical protein
VGGVNLQRRCLVLSSDASYLSCRSPNLLLLASTSLFAF